LFRIATLHLRIQGLSAGDFVRMAEGDYYCMSLRLRHA
jgi:hypothetical protein